MSKYRDDGAAARERARMLEEELSDAQRALSEKEKALDAREDELAALRARIQKAERSRPAAETKTAEPNATARSAKTSSKTRGLIFIAAAVTLGVTYGISALGPGPMNQVRVYVANGDVSAATFTVEGEGSSDERCTARVCDFKLPPGQYRIRAESGALRGSTDIVVRGSGSMATPIHLK